MKKALIITTVSGFVPQFELNNVKLLQSMGYEVHYAANYHTPVYTDNNDRLQGTGILAHQIDFVRSPFHLLKNIHAFHQLTALMRTISFDLVHCHTPMGGVLGRLAAQKTKTKPVLYTAHGFHFYKGAPIWNWVFFYPVERWLARYTDVLITINQEDYAQGCTFHLRKNGTVCLLPGVGIPVVSVDERPDNNVIQKKRKRYGIPSNSFVIVSIGELNRNKNHEIIIRAIAALKDNSIYYIICGRGSKKNDLEQLAHKLGVKNNLILLGYQTNIKKILQLADVYAIPSFREGLPVSLMEAMAVRLPAIASKIRGNVDLITDGYGGYLVPQNRLTLYVQAIQKMRHADRMKMGVYNYHCIRKYSEEEVMSKMKTIYTQVLSNKE